MASPVTNKTAPPPFAALPPVLQIEHARRLSPNTSERILLSSAALPEQTFDGSERSLDMSEISSDASERSFDVWETAPEMSEISLDVSERSFDISEISSDASERSFDVSETAPEMSDISLDVPEMAPHVSEVAPAPGVSEMRSRAFPGTPTPALGDAVAA